MPLLSIIVNFYCLSTTLLANLNKSNFNKLIEMIIFFRFFIRLFHVIQAIEVNIINLLLDVSETSIIALVGIRAVGYDPPIFIFFTSTSAALFTLVPFVSFNSAFFIILYPLHLVVAACLLLIFITF